MKQPYVRPSLIEYGRVQQLTLGAGGTKPDYQIDGPLDLINNNCDASDPATACLVVVPS